ncbi:SDR family oxidoreductase [Pararhizobium sp. DWP3-4]|uniref:SDR family oxidoreductase n=1 Tax=Pararhizobium sp. DWP3-4 TaxID=2804565 RepID=UPI003CED749B
MGRLQGKTAIVTGGGRGIGAAVALRFAREGALVMIADVDEGQGRATALDIAQKTGVKVIAHRCDVADPVSVVAMVDATRNQLGPANVLVNNAGIAVFREPLEMTPADWTRCMSVDLEGAWHCARAVLTDMLTNRDGAIINIISNHAFTVIKDTFPYPVAKHALLGLTRSLGLQYADRGISVNAISPGYTDTQIAQDDFDRHPDPARARAETEAKQPPGRLCKPEEVAAVAVLLASNEARFMIGENIVIDGGVSIRMYE